MSETTIYVVDDDEAVRDSLSGLFKTHGYQSRTFSSATEFLVSGLENATGCMIVDIQMPDISGLELQAELKRRGATIPLIILTSYGNVPNAVTALKSGAVDFIEKPFDVTILMKAIDEALNHNQPRMEAIASDEDYVSRLEILTPREREVMDLMVIGDPNKVVAAKLGISVRTAEVHRAKVLEKMNCRSLSALIHLILRQSPSAQ